MRAKIGDWVSIKSNTLGHLAAQGYGIRFEIIGFDADVNYFAVLDGNRGASIMQYHIDNWGIDPKYLGQTWWYLDERSIQDIFPNDTNEEPNIISSFQNEESGGLNLL
jgi:hypothetical protein